jgi:4-diphosphocytidyl-2-C-methyl-D-erythritol kinase
MTEHEAGGPPAVEERAYAKLNLVLHVGRPRPDGLHPICSIFASLDLADELRARPIAAADAGRRDPSGALDRPARRHPDRIDCPGVPGPNLAAAALAAFRERVPSLPPLDVRIEKRIPVAAGLGGGSADAAAALRAANAIAGHALDTSAMRDIAATLGSDVPSQVEPRHALVTGTGDRLEPLPLPPLAAVLVRQADGLETAAVYAQLDRMRGWREQLDPGAVRAVAEADPSTWAGSLENDLQPAALALRPELAAVVGDLRAHGALAALVTGSGPTCFGLFADRAAADGAAAAIQGAVVTQLRDG